MGDPFFDLGNFSINHELDADEDRVLLEAYDGEPARADRLARLTADADRVRLPRGDVGRPPAGHQHPRRRLRRATPASTSNGSWRAPRRRPSSGPSARPPGSNPGAVRRHRLDAQVDLRGSRSYGSRGDRPGGRRRAGGPGTGRRDRRRDHRLQRRLSPRRGRLDRRPPRREGPADRRLDLPGGRARDGLQPVVDDDGLPPLQRRAVRAARRVRADRQPAPRLEPGPAARARADGQPGARDRPRGRGGLGRRGAPAHAGDLARTRSTAPSTCPATAQLDPHGATHAVADAARGARRPDPDRASG